MTAIPDVEATLELAAPPAEVFTHLTDPARWMGSSAVLDARPGGRYEVTMSDGVLRGWRIQGEHPGPRRTSSGQTCPAK
jgi:uncharacterized protein YndB with AHSA1/START domain